MYAPVDLEMTLTRSLFAARTMMAAVTVSEGWEMRWGPIVVPAERTLTADGIDFSATFPEVCWLDQPEGGVSLLLDGEVMGVRAAQHPGDTSFVVTWALAVRVPTSV